MTSSRASPRLDAATSCKEAFLIAFWRDSAPKKAKVVIIIVIIIIIICNFGIIVAALLDDITGCRSLGAHILRQTRGEDERVRG